MVRSNEQYSAPKDRRYPDYDEANDQWLPKREAEESYCRRQHEESGNFVEDRPSHPRTTGPIYIPTHKVYPETEQDPIRPSNALKEAEK